MKQGLTSVPCRSTIIKNVIHIFMLKIYKIDKPYIETITKGKEEN